MGKGKALTLATLLLKHGAEPTRLLEPEFDYGGQTVRIPAEAADYMVALLLYVTPRPRGAAAKGIDFVCSHSYGLLRNAPA